MHCLALFSVVLVRQVQASPYDLSSTAKTNENKMKCKHERKHKHKFKNKSDFFLVKRCNSKCKLKVTMSSGNQR